MSKPLDATQIAAVASAEKLAIVLVRHGIVDRFPFKGDGKESPETVKAQNELLQAAISENLPASQAREGNAQGSTTRNAVNLGPNTYVEIGRDGSVNGEREIAMTQPGR